jgi:two-component system, NarL family, nitrate/nitrite response regulator NarL
MEPNPVARKICVLVADNSRIHSQSFANALQQDPDLAIAIWDSNPSSLIAAVAAQRVDVLAISSAFGGRCGAALKIVRELHSLHPKIRIVVLVDAPDSQLVTDLFRAGARGIFRRECSLEMFSKCIRSVAGGEIWAGNREVSLVVDALAASPVIRTADSAGWKLLSRREFEVVECVVQGMTNREIAERLKLSQHTVKNYLFRVFDKLGLSSRVELLFMTLGHHHDLGSKQGEAVFPDMLRQMFESGSEGCGGLDWLEKAADEGVAGAQLLLAQALAARGGNQEMVAAYTWFLMAAEQIRKTRSQLAVRLTPKQIEEAQQNAATWSARTEQMAPAVSAAGGQPAKTDKRAPQAPISSQIAKPALFVAGAPRETDPESSSGPRSAADHMLRYGSA